MLQELYFQEMQKSLDKIQATQKDAIAQCAEVIANSLTNGGAWHVLDTGHMLLHEAIGRSGGLMAIRPVITTVTVDNPIRRREKAVNKPRVFLDEIQGLPEFVIGKSNIIAGDVLIIGSVSGFNILPVGVALAARANGVITIALTAVEYSRQLESKHPSGHRLFEACDYVLDNCAPYGDALVDVAELEMAICPASGVAAAYINWALQAQVVQALLNKGVKPSLYKSNHLPGAGPHNTAALNRYEELGY